MKPHSAKLACKRHTVLQISAMVTYSPTHFDVGWTNAAVTPLCAFCFRCNKIKLFISVVVQACWIE